MVLQELKNLIESVQKLKCESQTLEIKSAHQGCPERLYDTLSAFSNQDDGGILLFGVDEKNNYALCGVYDPQDLQKKVMEYALQMTPVVRPSFTVIELDGKSFVSAEIPPLDVSERPCFKTGKGRLKGSYIRVGDSDQPMTEYEVYSYEAFRKKYQDDIRPVERASLATLDKLQLDNYLIHLKREKNNLSKLPDEQILELMSMTRSDSVTLSAVLLFCPFPQAYFPQLSIIATVIPGEEIGTLDAQGHRFLDTKRIDGPIPEMLEQALSFVRSNMHVRVKIDPQTGKRIDEPEYPLVAVREILLNALVHRDYSFHTEGMPIQLLLFSNRLEVISPGGLYGRMTIDQLGKVQADTRNPVLATALETLELTENRYSGIPTVRRLMADSGLPGPVFRNERGLFYAVLYNASQPNPVLSPLTDEETRLLEFCQIPRSRKELLDFLGLQSATYAIQRHVMPLVEAGKIQLSIPEKPKSRNQRFTTVSRK